MWGTVTLSAMSTEGGTRAVVAALLANLGIAVTKFIAFFLTGFSSMLAEAIAEAINAAEARAREATPDLTLLMYLEPDIDTGTRERPDWEHSQATLTDAADDPLPSSGSH